MLPLLAVALLAAQVQGLATCQSGAHAGAGVLSTDFLHPNAGAGHHLQDLAIPHRALQQTSLTDQRACIYSAFPNVMSR